MTGLWAALGAPALLLIAAVPVFRYTNIRSQARDTDVDLATLTALLNLPQEPR